jgi:hypothetical protein
LRTRKEKEIVGLACLASVETHAERHAAEVRENEAVVELVAPVALPPPLELDPS